MKKFENYHQRLQVLQQVSKQDLTNTFIISGIIDKYCVQFELAWKTLKVALLEEGCAKGKTGSPREILKCSFSYFSFLNEAIWLDMLHDRNDSTHLYDENMAVRLVQKILQVYIPAFQEMDAAFLHRW